MKNRTTKELISWSHEWMTYMFFFSLSLPDNILPLTVMLWAFSWVLWRISGPQEIVRFGHRGKLASCFFVFFLFLHFISAFWGDHLAEAPRYIENQLLLLFASVFLCFGIHSKVSTSKIIRAYFFGALASIVLFFLELLVTFLSDGVLKYQLDVLGMANYINQFKHPAYWCLNILSSFFLFFYTYYPITSKKWLYVILYFVLGVFIYWTGSRAGLISYVFIIGGGTFLQLIWKKIGTQGMIIFSSVLLLAFSALVFTNQKFKYIFDDTEHSSSVNAPRKVLWKSSVELILEQPILGYGIVTSKEKLIQRSKINGIYNADVKNYNCHNQYLEMSLESGLLSVFSFLIFFVLIYKKQKVKYRSFILLVLLAFAFLFESMLLRIAGVATFVAFVFLLMLNAIKEDKDLKFKEKHWQGLILLSIVIILLLFLMKWRSAHLSFNSDSPQSYASKNYTLVDNSELPGDLPQAIKASDACRFDHKAQASLWSGNAYMLNKLESKKLKEDQILKFSTYCYVSEDFDGAWVRASIDRDGGTNFGSSFYDLSKKGTWQKLEVIVEGETGEMPAYHYFCKEDANSFKELKGYVLFAYPQYIISEK